MITFIPHVITLLLCVAILVLAAINLRITFRQKPQDLLKLLILMAISWQVVTILFFVYNQSMWVLKEHSSLVGSVDAVLWIMYDYSNKFFHLTCGLILYYHLDSKNRKNFTEETLLSKWLCPVADTVELDRVKAQLDKLSQKIIPTTDVTGEDK